MWGGLCLRSIPASAGEPGVDNPSHRNEKVYPRECGGTGEITVGWPGVPGLSPRVRGNHALHPRPYHRCGSIPASAGEPTAPGGRGTEKGVYPRECGGTHDCTSDAQQNIGLSPRVRGNRDDFYYSHGSPGSIPASAGEPQPHHCPPPLRQVYPRECGGTVEAVRESMHQAGLSPRVRGNRGHVGLLPRNSRSIPASAGEPSHSGHSHTS